MATNAEKELQELKKEFAALKKELSGIGKTVSQLSHSAADEGRERLRDVADHSRQQARQKWDAFEHEIEERPMTSVAVALGIGFILGRLLDR